MDQVDAFLPGGTVPAVKVADLRAMLALTSAADRDDRSQTAVGVGILASGCNPGADVMAVWLRCTLLGFAEQFGEISRFRRGKDWDESFLRLWASFPFRAGEPRSEGSLPLNVEEFEAALRNL